MRLALLTLLALGCGDPVSDRSPALPSDGGVRLDACVDGVGRCGDGLEICEAGDWRLLGQCPAGSVCSSGACLPRACAGGCDGRECGCNGLCGLCPADRECGEDGRCRIPGSRCGDGHCLDDEACDLCPSDCGCPAGELCNPSNGECSRCVPQCSPEWECGSDGCGGTCRVCDGRCDDRRCVPCDRRCAGRACGDDGCEGVCGECAAGAACEAGVCVVAPTPDCAGRICGDDGIGGLCGECAVNERCQAGRCAQTPTECGDRICEGDETCRSCRFDCGVCCGNGVCQPELGEGCVSCPRDCACDPHERCREALDRCVVVCEPQCAGRECGPDGCGGSCATCPAPLACDDEAGRCR